MPELVMMKFAEEITTFGELSLGSLFEHCDKLYVKIAAHGFNAIRLGHDEAKAFWSHNRVTQLHEVGMYPDGFSEDNEEITQVCKTKPGGCCGC